MIYICTPPLSSTFGNAGIQAFHPSFGAVRACTRPPHSSRPLYVRHAVVCAPVRSLPP